eukprot:scaffold3065_cov72-Skeletonema_menzelii.AAC.2
MARPVTMTATSIDMPTANIPYAIFFTSSPIQAVRSIHEDDDAIKKLHFPPHGTNMLFYKRTDGNRLFVSSTSKQ